ncbi:MAG: hypothetical protein LBO72_09670 [Helicobacteraceae bacterium]|jgi:tRNA 2-selenouridine synthase|nr:hypothetical protein [Helicobacteraceae bacterium]
MKDTITTLFFGESADAQPKTVKFENDLQYALSRLDLKTPIAIEAESKSIGRVTLPPKLYAAMQKGFRVHIQTPIEDRIKRAASEYGAISTEFFNEAPTKIAPHLPRKIVLAVSEAFSKRDLDACAFLLLSEYYDKVYRKAPKYGRDRPL